MDLVLKILLALYLGVGISQLIFPPALGTVVLAESSVEALTTPTSFNWLEYVTAVAVAFGLVSLLRALSKRLKLPNFRAFSESRPGEVDKLYWLGLRHGYGQSGGLFGDIDQVNTNWVGPWSNLRTALSTELGSDNLAVQEILTYWDTFELELLSGRTVFLIQTMLLQAIVPGCLPLTIVREYYSLSFDWWQQLHFAETNYMASETFKEFLKFLNLGTSFSKVKLKSLVVLYSSLRQDPKSNHKQLLWFKLISPEQEVQND